MLKKIDEQSKYWKRYFIKAKIATQIIKNIPYIRMVGLNGSMVRGKFTKQSDIDFLIIASKNRLFSVRFLVIVILSVLQLKRSENKNSAGKICLNRWATTSKLEIYPHNKYHAWTFSNLLPLYSERNTYEKFIISNQWMSGFGYPVIKNEILFDKLYLSFIKTAFEKLLNRRFGDFIEKIMKQYQVERINNKQLYSPKAWNIVVTNDELCFHLKVDHNKIVYE